MKQQHLWTRGAAALALVMSLGACAPLVVGGMVGIELRSANRIREMLGSRVHINVTSYNRQVLLTGEVPSQKDKDYANQLVSQVDNVRAVVNELVVGPTSSLSDRSMDTLISGKVKASMVDSKDIFASAFKVVTERGTVYLMGRVTQREAQRASDLARQVSGVKKVVRIFDILTEEELQALLPPPPKSAAPAPAGDAK
jgi:osmotically-inducible protein OsmY